MDIVFVLDSSGSVRGNNFDKMKVFLKELVDKINVEPGASNIGVLTYSTTAEVSICG